jgi:hypothetical protein
MQWSGCENLDRHCRDLNQNRPVMIVCDDGTPPRKRETLMPLFRSTCRDFLFAAALVAPVFAAAACRPASAQGSTPAVTAGQPAKPDTVSKVRTKSKETWADMKARWAKQKDRWAECQQKEKAQKRSRTARREFLEDCMTGQ